ncbi:hypothetical protein GYMLUDRAFT_932752 [Collybiopsis luxurians FD-317 M1]|nr:hypothetical protein GYMLUDRAFT_932752 [Collybiopsis luxurians FD-317 M1]
MMKSKQLFFNRLDELLDCSDSDSGTRYIVRMTSGCANNSEQEGPGLEIPSRFHMSFLGTLAPCSNSAFFYRGIKRKLAGSSALRFQSPRNKRLKGAANQFISNARLDDQIATSEGYVPFLFNGKTHKRVQSNVLLLFPVRNENKDVGYEASTPKILTPAGSVTPEFEPISVSSKHAIRRKRKSAEVDKVTAGAPAQVEEAMNIDEEVFERKGTAASLSAMRLADTYPYTSSAPSSPIEDASAFSAAQRKPPAPQISILDLNMAQAVESAARKAAERTATANKSASMKLLPKRLLLRPVVDPAADQTSIIDNFSTSAPTSPEPRSPSPVPTKSGKSSKSALKPGKVPKTAIKSTAKAKGKQKPEKQSVYDWTIAEQELWITGKKKPDPRLVQFLGGFTIFYVGFDFSSRYMIDDGTSKCIKIILRHGGQVAPTYDPSKVTHVVLAKGVSKAHLLRAAKVKSLTDIPEHIPLLEWRWINALQSMNPDMERGRPPREIRLIPDERLFSYGHFSERLPPVFLHPMGRKQSLKRNASKGSGEISHISQYSADEHDSNKEESDDEQLASRQRAVVNRGLKKSAPSRVPLNLKPILNEISDPLLQCFVEVNQREQYFPQYRNMFDSDTETSDFESNEETLGPKRGV